MLVWGAAPPLPHQFAARKGGGGLVPSWVLPPPVVRARELVVLKGALNGAPYCGVLDR